MIGSFSWAKLHEWTGRLRILMIIHIVLVMMNYSLLLICVFLSKEFSTAIFPLVAICGFFFGLIDYLINTITNNAISKAYSEADVPFAFGWYRFMFCIGFFIASCLSSLLPSVSNNLYELSFKNYGFLIIIALNIIIMINSVVFGLFLDVELYEKRRRPSVNEYQRRFSEISISH